MSAPDPQEAWRRLQTELQRRSARFGGAGGGAPRGLGGGAAAVVLLVGGVWAANNALFNGAYNLPRDRKKLGSKYDG